MHPMGSAVAKDFHQLQFSPRDICHSAQQGRGDDDKQKTRSQDVAIELSVDEFAPPKDHGIVDYFARFVTVRSQGIEKNRKDGSRDHKRIHAVRPIVHRPSLFDLFGCFLRSAVFCCNSGCIAHVSKIVSPLYFCADDS